MFWIRAAVKRSQLLQSREIPLPAKIYDTHRKYEIARAEIKAATGKAATLAQVADHMNVREKTLGNCVDAMAQRIYSIDAAVVTNQKSSASAGGSTEIGSLINYLECDVDEFDNVEIEM
jgi:RNA polymerase primary sigma factor